MREPLILVGGSGFIGTAVTPLLRRQGSEVVVVDRLPPGADVSDGVRWLPRDLLTDNLTEDGALPPGHVVLLAGTGDPRPRWTWTLPLDIAMTTARLLPALRNRTVTLISSVEVYGFAPPPLSESTTPVLPMTSAELGTWCADARVAAAAGPCPPWRAAALCRRLADADPSGRWVYALSKLAQELLVQSVVAEPDLCILRLANTFGVGQERVVTRLVRSALRQRPIQLNASAQRSFLAAEDVADLLLRPLGPGLFNIGHPPISIEELASVVGQVCGALVPSSEPASVAAVDSCGMIDTSRATAAGMLLRPLTEALGDVAERMRHDQPPLFAQPLPVVIPPRPVRPDEVADRQQAALWSGLVKHGNRWSTELTETLRETLDLAPDDELLVTKSGTYALRLALAATVGPARKGDIAILPSFTYRATADVLVQLGYGLRYVDVDAWSWTLDPTAVEVALRDERVRLVMCVDTFGNPCAYRALRELCERRGVPLIADSAAALGSTSAGRPVGRQAHAHAFSMSFAKALTAAGAGGAVVLAARARSHDPFAWLNSSLIDELHAAAALDQLGVLPELVLRRNSAARLYEATAARLGLAYQGVSPDNVHSYVHWVVQVSEREELATRLAQLGVQTKPYFPAQHLHYELPAHGRHLPVTERLDREALALPMSSELSLSQVEGVASALEEAAAHHKVHPESLRRPMPVHREAGRLVAPAPSARKPATGKG
jgi:dTDP-4-amino-4,6-dideoxygalactose transaminase/nucleoside-diphosphate-sugar epimerase